MNELFKKRRADFTGQCLKYLRYVFNDHFVLVLLFLLGFSMVQYSQLLRNFPENKLPIIIVLVILVLVLLSFGSLATYLEEADKQFLLVKEREVLVWFNQAMRRSVLIWTLIQTSLLLILAPLFLKLGMSLPIFALFLVLLAVLRVLITSLKGKKLKDDGRLIWDRAIAYEANRQQSILKFFSLFTAVKGISTRVKRRSYLDGLLVMVKKKHDRTWFYLYSRAFLRSADYLALTLRLLLLSLLALTFVPNRLLAVALVLVFNYLLLFQLLALYHQFDYHYMTQLYPVERAAKAQNLKQFLRYLAYALMLIELAFSFSIQGAAMLFVGMVVMAEAYLPYKIKKMID